MCDTRALDDASRPTLETKLQRIILVLPVSSSSRKLGVVMRQRLRGAPGLTLNGSGERIKKWLQVKQLPGQGQWAGGRRVDPGRVDEPTRRSCVVRRTDRGVVE